VLRLSAIGCEKSPITRKLGLDLLGRFRQILEVTRLVAERYGQIVAQVPPGLHIGQNDYWIAAIAMTHDLVLITNDPDFDRVVGLEKENWLS